MNDQDLAEYLGQHMKVKYEVTDNTIEDNSFTGKITLTNSGPKSIHQDNWSLYFYHVRQLTSSVGKTGSLTAQISHIDGGLFKLQPLHSFLPWPSKASHEIDFTGDWSVIARSDLLPNWYVVVGEVAKVVKDTTSEDLAYVMPFSSPKQWKRNANDSYNPYTARHRYQMNIVEDQGRSSKLVIPTPHHAVQQEGTVTVDKSWVIVAPQQLHPEALHLSEKTGLKVVSVTPRGNCIKLALGPVSAADDADDDAAAGDAVGDTADATDSFEIYQLLVNPSDTITIDSLTSAGVFYGIQTLLGLMDTTGSVPIVRITDFPRFPYRGFMLDVSRNFFNKKEVLKVLDLMAAYKLNTLHLHLADDEGWRIEIPGIPELTQVGGRRGHDPTEENYILPALGSGPDPTGLGCGFYTQQDYRDILQHAARRHIRVVPEIDMPGHSSAAIKAMKARYSRHKESDPKVAAQYLLHDLEDTSQYKSVQQFKQNVINPCIESSYAFVEKVLTTLKGYHKDIQPLETFHLGGDEVSPDALQGSPACAAFQAKEGEMSAKQLKEHFVKKVVEMAAAHQVAIQGWEDAFYNESNQLLARKSLPNTVTANAWISKWESKKAHRAHEMANADFKVVLTSATHLYFDHPYEPDPEERGLYWATRHTDLRKVFNFQPQHFWSNMDTDRDGNSMSMDKLCDKGIKCTPLTKPENVIGMEAALWGETVRAVEHLHTMVVLRLLALAERAWYRAPWEGRPEIDHSNQQDWANFVNHLGYRELQKLEEEGFEYYLPLPGARLEEGKWVVNTAIPGLPVQYSTDGGQSWHDLAPSSTLPQDPPLVFATRSFDGRRRSRSVDPFLTFQSF